ncbi:MAG: hypothetical protein K2K60_02465 [Clostridia bacterium]|nr:hypothetical protein [Clostridia bacterium]
MKKLFKGLTLALTVALAAVCISVFAAACDKGGDKDEGEVYSVYVVYEDGTPVNGHTDGTGYDMGTNASTYVFVKWCKGTACPNPIPLGTDGKAKISASKLESEIGGAPDYVEILYVKNVNSYNAAENISAHLSVTSTGEVKITLTKAS